MLIGGEEIGRAAVTKKCEGKKMWWCKAAGWKGRSQGAKMV